MVRCGPNSRRPERRWVTSFEEQLVVAVTHRTFTIMATKTEILEQCGQTREQTCIQRIQKPRGIRGGYTSTIVMCGSPGRCGRRTAQQGSDTAPIAPISSTGTTQPFRMQHCHRARPIRISACSGPYSSVAGGLPSLPVTLSEGFRSTRNGYQAESVPDWQKLRSSTHTLYSISHTTEYTAVGLKRAGLVAVRWKACDVLIANSRDS